MKIKKISQTDSFYIIQTEDEDNFRYISKTPTSTCEDLMTIEILLISLCEFATNKQQRGTNDI